MWDVLYNFGLEIYFAVAVGGGTGDVVVNFVVDESRDDAVAVHVADDVA